MQPNIAMKFAEYVLRILLCKRCKFDENFSTIPVGYLLWRAL